MANYIKKGQIKQKTGANSFDILRPETEADIVLYDNTSSELTATDVQAAIDEVASAVVQAGKVDDVKIQVDAATPTTIVSNKIAIIPVTSSYSGTSETIVNGKAIKAAIDGLDVSEFNLTETNTTTNVVTLHGIKEADGKIAVGTTSSNDVTFYNKTGADNAISTAINALDTSSDVRIAPVDGGIISFKDIKEVNGIVSASSTDTGIQTYTKGTLDTKFGDKLDKLTTNGNKVYAHQGATQTEYGVDSGSSPNYIVQRDANGQVIVPLTPTDNSHAASKKYVDDKITSGVEYLGIINNTTELYALDSSAGEGDWVRVGTEFIYSSETCHVGDILICSAAKGSSTHATWDVLHTEVDTDTNTTYRALVGTGSSTTGDVYAGSIKLQAKELGGSWADQDTIKLISGTSSKISITPDDTNKKLTFEHAAGTGASQSSGFYKFSTDSTSHISGVTAVAKADLTGLGVADDDNVIHKGTFASPASAEIRYGDLTIYGTSGLVSSLVVTKDAVSAGDPNGGSMVPMRASKFVTYDEGSSYLSDKATYDATKITFRKNNSGTFTAYDLAFPTKSGTIALTSDIPDVDDFVTGPASNTENALALFNGTTGKVLKDSGVYYRGTNPASGSVFQVHGNTADFHYVGNGSRPSIYVAGGTAGDLGTSSNKWHDLYLSNNLSDGTNSTTIANIISGLTDCIVSGTNASGFIIESSRNNRTLTLGDSGVIAGIYSAVKVNAKGIVTAGYQVLEVVESGASPSVVNHGWYFDVSSSVEITE